MLGGKDLCDEVTGQDEEHIDAEEPSPETRRPGMEAQHQQDREGADAIQGGVIGHAGDATPWRRSGAGTLHCAQFQVVIH